jgi:mannose-P-dolichol utilization defect 1
LLAYILETLSYAITLAYSFRNDFPFSTYGENLFLTIQNVIITLLIIYLPTSSLRRPQNTASRLGVASITFIVVALALYTLPKPTLSLLQLSTLPLSVFSKFPQIRQNFRAQSTGQLSAFAVIAQIAGCLARLFTTATEVGDQLLSAGFALALLLNCVLGAQMWMYWGNDEVKQEFATAEREKQNVLQPWQAQAQAQNRVDGVVPPQPPITHVGPPPSGRKWARKVD